jgi:hypothetical protein
MSAYERLSEEIRNRQPIHLGKYWQEKAGDTWIKTPIEWIIIHKSSVPYTPTNSQTYTLELISKKVLYYSQWGMGFGPSNWLGSAIRRKLQDQLSEIFDDDEIFFIQEVPANKDCIYDEAARRLDAASYDEIVNSKWCKEAKERLLQKDQLYLISYDFEKFRIYSDMANRGEISSKELHESFATDYALENCSTFDRSKGPGGVEYWTKTVVNNREFEKSDEIKVGLICGLGSGGGARSPDYIAGIRPCITIEITA